ncbi:SDR family NAD(P)-dependent oxidoreductase [Microbacterium sp. NPDC077184]|uniref:SDR family NAD(P)-dependent oxidoreductase n=1 Tax=Microbacterium sp. NPDC077184 TaxID=3154764 RepID=UPI00343F052A
MSEAGEIDAATPAVRGRRVVIAGATSASGLACARELAAAGAEVIVVGRDAARLAALVDEVRAATGRDISAEVCDLADESAVADLVARIHAADGAVDGVVHLVGGWRGGGGLAGQTEEDYRALETALTSLRHVSRAVDDDLKASAAGRLAIVSSTSVERPLAGSANYVALKAAAEAWTRAVGQGYAKAARDAGEEPRAASVIFRVKSLDGLEDDLARAVVGLWDAAPDDLSAPITLG